MADTLLATTLRWTLDKLSDVARSAALPTSNEGIEARRRLSVALELLEYEPVASVTPTAPVPVELLAVAAEGQPWRGLEPVARRMRDAGVDGALRDLATKLIAPDPELAWRLFHLAVLGELLQALRGAGASIVSLRPLGASTPGPAYRVIDAADRAWDLWFEAAGAWRTYTARRRTHLQHPAHPEQGRPSGRISCSSG